MTTTNIEAKVNPTVPLTEILETYTQCLAMSRDYVENDLRHTSDDDVDIDRLSNFLNVRADLFSIAESSFNTLTEASGQDGDEAVEARKELTSRVVAILEEMTEIEHQLTNFLGDRLNKIKHTIHQMQQTQPVFKHYGHLGGKINPSRITRHG